MRIWLITLTLLVSTVVAPALVRAEPPMSVRIYSVADLVVRPAQSGTRLDPQSELMAQVQIAANVAANVRGKPAPEDELAQQNLSKLADVVETVAVPTQWEAAGGSGRIAVYPETFCLIIRQTEVGHEEVSDLLHRLRAENAVKVKLSVQYFAPHQRPSTFLAKSDQPEEVPPAPASIDSIFERLTEKFGSSFDEQKLADVRKHLEQVAGIELSHTTQLSNARSNSVGQFTYSAVVSQDRRFVEVNINLFLDESGVMSYAIRLPAGRSKVLQMPVFEDSGFLALVTASIDIPEQAEQLAGQHNLASVRQIESAPRGGQHDSLELKTYSVTDLVTQGESQFETTASRADWTDGRVEVSEEIERLVSFLREIAPDDLWKNGTSIVPHFNTHQLVVRQTPAGHREIDQLLNMLREPAGRVVRFQLVPIVFGEKGSGSELVEKINSIVNLATLLNSFNASRPLLPDESAQIVDCLPPELRAAAVKLVIPNGWRRIEATTQCLRITPLVSPDRRQAKVFIDSVVDEQGPDAFVISRTRFEVQDGQSVLLHTYNDGAQRLWLITVHIGDDKAPAAETAKMPRPDEPAAADAGKDSSKS